MAVCGVFVLSACREASYNNKEIVDQGIQSSIGSNKTSQAEYIIVLKENVSISDAINGLKKYDAQVIRDLKRRRYLIGLERNPGIEHLQKDIEGSEYIEYIQPNFTYTTQ